MSVEFNSFVRRAVSLFLNNRGTILDIDANLNQVVIQMNDSNIPIKLPIGRFTIEEN